MTVGNSDLGILVVIKESGLKVMTINVLWNGLSKNFKNALIEEVIV